MIEVIIFKGTGADRSIHVRAWVENAEDALVLARKLWIEALDKGVGKPSAVFMVEGRMVAMVTRLNTLNDALMEVVS